MIKREIELMNSNNSLLGTHLRQFKSEMDTLESIGIIILHTFAIGRGKAITNNYACF